MTCGSLSDQELACAARAGGDWAFAELYERYRSPIKSFALRLTRDCHRAEDITQEVFISALRRLRETSSPISFRPWIYEIARNACIDDHRRSIRVREVSTDPETIEGRVASTLTAPPPHIAFESKEQLEHLRGAFRQLSERHHRVIVLRELEGRTYSQIGDELGMSKVVVESTLFRARRRLSEEYEDLTSGRRCEHVQQILGNREDRPLGRLGVRDRRAVSHHLQHCRQCRLEFAAAGLDAPQPVPAIRRVAGILPVPLITVLRRGGAAVSSATRGVHHSLQAAAAPLTGYAEAGASLGYAGRLAATAATVVAAVAGAGLVSGTTATSTPVSPAPRVALEAHRVNGRLFDHRFADRRPMPSAPSAAGGHPIRHRRPGTVESGARSRASGSSGASRGTAGGGGGGGGGGGSGRSGTGGARPAPSALHLPSSTAGAGVPSGAELADQRMQVSSLTNPAVSLVSSPPAPRVAVPPAGGLPGPAAPQAPASPDAASGAMQRLTGTRAADT